MPQVLRQTKQNHKLKMFEIHVYCRDLQHHATITAHSFPFQSIRCHGMLLFNPKQIPQIKNKYHHHPRAAGHPTTVTLCSICTLSSIRSVALSRCHISIPTLLSIQQAWREINPLLTGAGNVVCCPTSAFLLLPGHKILVLSWLCIVSATECDLLKLVLSGNFIALSFLNYTLLHKHPFSFAT